MKKLFSACLSLVLLAALTLPALAAGEDAPVLEIVLISAPVVWETTEDTALWDETYDEDYDWEAEWAAQEAEAAAARQAALNTAKAELGGLPGEYGVMVNGKYVTFGGGRIYAERGVLLVPRDAYLAALGLSSLPPTLTAGPYLRDGVWYVGLRQVAEYAGYTVWWDEQMETAVLIDRAAVIAKYDKQFTTLNRLLARELALLGSGTAKGMAELDLSVTVFNTLDGDTRYDFSVDTTYHASATAADMDISMDLSDLGELAETLLPSLAGAVGGAPSWLTDLLGGLGKVSCTVRLDLDTGRLYLRAPLLSVLLPGLDADDWISVNLFPFEPIEGLRPGEAATVGALGWYAFSARYNGGYYADLYSTEVDTTTPVYAWAGITAGLDLLSSALGDAAFRPESNWKSVTVGLEDARALLALLTEQDEFSLTELTLAEFDCKVTVRPDDNYTITLTARPRLTTMGVQTTDCRVTLQLRADGRETALTAEAHLKNSMKLNLKLSQSWTATSLPVATTPPEGANILEL